MKRLFSGIVMLLMVLSLSSAAFADVANEHIDDFYWRNSGKFDHSVSGYYYVDSEDGYVTAWTSPAALKFVENITNGTVLYIQASYKGWATSVYSADGKYVDANQWLPLDRLTPKYSQQDFQRDYAAMIDRYSPDSDFFKSYAPKGSLCFYTYPGSGELCNSVFLPGEELTLGAVYTDGDGQRWGYCDYYSYLEINGWVCLDAPEDPALPRTLDNDPVLKSEPLPPEELAAAARLRYDRVVSGAVCAAIAAASAATVVASILIYKARKGRRSNSAPAPASE